MFMEKPGSGGRRMGPGGSKAGIARSEVTGASRARLPQTLVRATSGSECAWRHALLPHFARACLILISMFCVTIMSVTPPGRL